MRVAQEETVLRNLLAVFLVTGALNSASAADAVFTKISGGRVLHKPSNIVLPSRVGLFHLAGTSVYGSGGRDAGAGYNVVQLIRGDV